MATDDDRVVPFVKDNKHRYAPSIAHLDEHLADIYRVTITEASYAAGVLNVALAAHLSTAGPPAARTLVTRPVWRPDTGEPVPLTDLSSMIVLTGRSIDPTRPNSNVITLTASDLATLVSTGTLDMSP